MDNNQLTFLKEAVTSSDPVRNLQNIIRRINSLKFTEFIEIWQALHYFKIANPEVSNTTEWKIISKMLKNRNKTFRKEVLPDGRVRCSPSPEDTQLKHLEALEGDFPLE